MRAVELAIFRLKPDIDEDAFRAAIGETDRWLARQPGFLLRRHGTAENGDRVDYLEWDAMSSARVAAQAFTTAPETKRFMAAIEPDSIVMRHFELVS
jgi:hypothetical protein